MTVESYLAGWGAHAARIGSKAALPFARADRERREKVALLLAKHGAKLKPGGLPLDNIAARWARACRALDAGYHPELASVLNGFASYAMSAATGARRRLRAVRPFTMGLKTLAAVRALCAALAATEAAP